MFQNTEYPHLPSLYNTLEKHLTVTGYIFTPDFTEVLLIKHKKLNKWMPPGGHLESKEMPHDGILREIFEETGLVATFVKQHNLNLKLPPESEWELPSPYFTMLQLIPATTNKTQHYHYDFIYILQTSRTELELNTDETNGIGWFKKNQIKDLDTFNTTQIICRDIML
jgi:8-oxo-dGTP diphosphatase